MEFSIDKTTITEGDVVEVSWSCNGSPQLVIDNGYKESRIDLPPQGCKRFRLNRSKGRTRISLVGAENGRKCSKSFKVKVRPVETVRVETVYADGKSGLLRDCKARMQGWWQKFRLAFGTLPVQKQMAYKILGLLLVGMVLGMLSPRLSSAGLFLLLAYLGWIIIRR